MDFTPLTDAIAEHLRPAQAKAEKLRNLDLFVLDNSLRESTVGQVRGHTLANKWAILDEVHKCGFTEINVASFSHAPRVDDDFVKELCKRYADDLTPYYAFSEIGEGPDKNECPVGLTKIMKYGLQNVIFEIDIAVEGYNPEHMYGLLRRRIEEVHKEIGQHSKILVNLRDFPFAMQQNPEQVFSVIHYLASNPDIRPAGIIYEEPTGRFSLDALAAWTKAVRTLMNDCGWTDGHLLTHIHEKWGYAVAAQLECLASGANGMWASVCNEGAALGHASSTVSIMNLVRMGNKIVTDKYICTYLRKAAQNVTLCTTSRKADPKQIVYGERALDQAFDFGGIAGGEVGDGDFDIAAFFGEEPPRRMSTLASAAMVKERLVNVFGEDDAFTDEVCEKMKGLMVQDLVENKKDEYMTPMGLALLFGRSGEMLTEKMSLVVEKYDTHYEVHQQLIQDVRDEWDEWDTREERKDDDRLEFYSFYNAFMAPYFGCYECDEARKALAAIDMDKDGAVDWREFELYLKWALAQHPDMPNADELLAFAFIRGIIPDMQDRLRRTRRA